MKAKKVKKITKFDFLEGDLVAGKYKVIEKLGGGWEGEVYKIAELNTKIERAAKFFFPHRNIRNKVANLYARKLHKLSSCSILIHYHTQEQIWYEDHLVTCLISEYVEGEILADYLKKQKGQRIGVFSSLQLLHSLVSGLEQMHRLGEYHGDLHTENVMVRRYGLGYDLKLLDMYHWQDSKAANKAEDLVNSIRIFAEALGGKVHYQKLPLEIKKIILGMRKDLILKKFRSASQLKEYIENIEWTSSDRI